MGAFDHLPEVPDGWPGSCRSLMSGLRWRTVTICRMSWILICSSPSMRYDLLQSCNDASSLKCDGTHTSILWGFHRTRQSSRCQPHKCALQDGRAHLAFVLLRRWSIRA